MTGAATQFGYDIDQLRAVSSTGLNWPPGVRVTGVHLFSLSNARDETSLLAELRSSVRTAAALRDELHLPMEFVDLGGGFATPYAEPGSRPTYPNLRAALAAELDEHLPGWRLGDPVVAFESGRYLVGSSGSLICTAMETKHARDVEFLLLDSGINHLGGMGGLGRLLRPAATPQDATPDNRQLTLVGPLCTPADVLGRNISVSPPTPGRAVVFPNVGAYGLTAGLLGFLSRPTPAEVTTYHDEIVSASRVELLRTAL